MTDASLHPLEVKGLDPVTGAAPKMRIESVDAARNVYESVRKSDEGSSRNRSLIDGMFNGAPPFVQADLVEIGQGDRTNIDFGEAAALKDQALAGYYDLTSSVDVLARVETSYGTPEQQSEWNQILSEEFHETLKEWQEFEFNHQILCDQFVSHGVGVSYFEDEVDWRWRVAGLGEFRIPRGTKANEYEIEVATVEREYQAHQLYSYIRHPEVAKTLGWDVPTVKAALMRACLEQQTPRIGEWEKLEVQLKNNDLLYGNAKSKKVTVVHMWVREFSGKVTHLMFLRDPIGTEYGETEKFLFKRPDRFDSPTKCFVTFTYGVGNGTYHGIRGLGFRIYPHIQLLNRLRCGMVDGALLSSSLIVQPTDSSSRALEDLTLTYAGPYALFPPGLKIVEKAVPNFENNIIPVLGDLSQQVQNNTGAYQTRSTTRDGQARTAYEIRAQLQKESVLSQASVNLFYHPWKRLLTEIYSRLSRKGYTALEPGGREAVDFRMRCLSRGVPEQAIYRVERVEPVRAIGFGSPGMRMAAIDETMQIFGSLDERGRVNLLRDRIAARFGQEVVDRYLPAPGSAMRPPIDDKIAVLENTDLGNGVPIPVSPGENHFIHASRHLTACDQLEQALSQGVVEPVKVAQAFQAFLPHLASHLEGLGQDTVRKDEVALMRQRLQQLAAASQRLNDELSAQQENAAKAQQAEQQRVMQAEQARVADMERQLAEAQQLSPKAQQDIAERQAKLQMDVERHQAQMALKQAEATQKFSLRDAETAAKVASLGRPAVPEIAGGRQI